MSYFRYFSLIFLIVCFTSYNHVYSANILGLFTTQSKSHLVIHFAIVRALVERGHNVTVVTTIPFKEPNLSGYRHLVLKSEQSYENAVKEMIKSNGTMSRHAKTFDAIKLIMDISSNVTLTDEFQKIMGEEKFDLLLLGYIFNEFHLGLSAHFNCPTVLVWVQKPFHIIDKLVGNPVFALDFLRMHDMPFSFTNEHSFYNRVMNFLLAVFELTTSYFYDYIQNLYYKALFPPEKYPSYETVLKNVSLLLCNHHFSEGFIRAIVPAFVEIGGIQIKSKPDPLPKDIKQLLDNSTQHGAILFSLGSNAKFSDLKPTVVQQMFKALSNLKENVIWKWDNDKPPGYSKNILFKTWLPQDDILAHPNVRLFITHGGKGSVVEAAYHGIPMLGLPMFADQPTNINEMVYKGFGISVDVNNMTDNLFKNSVLEVLENNSYTNAIKIYSQLYRDRPLTAKETAVFWIEYVIRHKGAKHLQSPSVSMTNVQLLGLDVQAFLVGVVYIIFKLIKFVLKFLWHKCCSRKTLKIVKIKNKKPKKE